MDLLSNTVVESMVHFVKIRLTSPRDTTAPVKVEFRYVSKKRKYDAGH